MELQSGYAAADRTIGLAVGPPPKAHAGEELGIRTLLPPPSGTGLVEVEGEASAATTGIDWKQPAALIAGVIWLVAVGAGMKLLLDFQVKPGVAANPPPLWPASARIPRAPGQHLLLVIAHPRCPCTRATLGELARIMARADRGLQAYVLFVVPPGRDARWAKADLWHGASQIPGVRLVLDADGTEARRFGVATSGQALVYDAAGRLAFAGGITAGRGHAGDNAGEAAIVSLVRRDSAERSITPVFGCALTNMPSSPGRSGPTCPR